MLLNFSEALYAQVGARGDRRFLKSKKSRFAHFSRLPQSEQAKLLSAYKKFGFGRHFLASPIQTSLIVFGLSKTFAFSRRFLASAIQTSLIALGLSKTFAIFGLLKRIIRLNRNLPARCLSARCGERFGWLTGGAPSGGVLRTCRRTESLLMFPALSLRLRQTEPRPGKRWERVCGI